MQKRSIKETTILVCSLISALGVAPFAFIRFANGDHYIALFDLFIVITHALAFTYVFKTHKTQGPSQLLVNFSLLAIAFIVYVKGPDFIFWVYPTLLVAHYMLTSRGAIIFSLFGFIVLFPVLFNQADSIRLISFAATYSITCLLSAVFLKTIRIHDETSLKNQRINSYRNHILELISGSSALPETLKAITEATEKEFEHIKCSILLLDSNKKTLSAGSVDTLPQFYNDAINNLPAEQGIGSCGTSAFTGERVIVEDIATHPFWADWTELAKKANLGSCWSEAIKSSTGKILGTFAIYHTHPAKPTTEQLKLMDIFSHMASIAIERESSNQLIWQQANFDSLTNLPNRNMMVEYLSAAIGHSKRSQKKLAVLFLDLDNFKDINDSLGHEIGDLLLIEAAARINHSIRENDTVARLGGDEFVIIITELADADGTNRIVQNLLYNLSRPYQLKDKVVHSSASIGITLYPDDACDMQSLLRNADQAMYGAKALGRNNFHHFTKKMHEAALAKMSINNDLRKAITNNEFQLVYQPIVDLKTYRLNKAEALIRWNHPIRGLVSPLDFIPIAEETGLIIDISNWIFKEATKNVKKWRQSYNQHLQISINTSPRQYNKSDGNIMKWLSWLKEFEIDPRSVAFEITENLLMESHEQLEKVLDEIKKHDVELSIDDFGTGYSSFAYLREFQTHYLKIDKSFVQKMSEGSNDIALCEAIIGMAKKLKIKVIAEGIETEEQKSLLENMCCDFGQGYLFSKPVSADEFEELLRIDNKPAEVKTARFI